MLIMKFGGTSVADNNAINQVVDIIKVERSKTKRGVFVVTSALANITNLLLESAQGNTTKFMSEIEKRHTEVLEGFRVAIQSQFRPLLQKHFLQLRKELGHEDKSENCVSKEYLDLIASFGERMASLLLTAALLNKNINATRIDSRDIVETDSNFGNAEVDLLSTRRNFIEKIQPLLRKGIIPVMTGFIGKDTEGKTTTLGRGGSDYSAALAGLMLNAKEIQIWKDVPGFMTADPRVVKNAKMIPRLSFSEAAELAYFGAKLLHPKTIRPAIQKNIPVRILNTFQPEDLGTLIYGKLSGRSSRSASFSRKPCAAIRAISYKKSITVINIISLRMLGPYGFLERLFAIFSHHRVPIDVIATSEVSVSVTVEDSAMTKALIMDLKKIGVVEIHKSHAIISIVGAGLKNDPTAIATILEVLRKKQIPTEMISLGASSINFTCIIEEKHCINAVNALHSKFFS